MKIKLNGPKSQFFTTTNILLILSVANLMFIGAIFSYVNYSNQSADNTRIEIKNLADNAVTLNQKIIDNQDDNTRKINILLQAETERSLAEEESRRQLGELWLKFMNAMLVDIEQQQDEQTKALGINITDRIINNGTHIKFDNDTIEIIKGIPKINLTTKSNNTVGN